MCYVQTTSRDVVHPACWLMTNPNTNRNGIGNDIGFATCFSWNSIKLH